MMRDFWFGLRLIAVLALLCIPAITFAQNTPCVLFPSAARTTTVNSQDTINAQYRGVSVVVNVSAYTSGTYTAVIQGKDPVSGAYYTILSSAALGATGTTVLRVHPGITVASNLAVADLLPYVWRLQLTSASAIMTISASCSLLQ